MKKDLEQEFYRLLGLRIKEAREKHRPLITQECLADSIGMSRTSVVNIEQGRHHIQVHTLIEIAKQLKVHLQELIPEISANKVLETPVLTNTFVSRELESVTESILKSTNKKVELNVPEN